MSRSPHVVRRVRAGDGAGIARVHVAAWRRAYAGIMPEDRLAALSVRTSSRRWETIVTTPTETRAFVAESDGEIVGVGAAGPPREPGPADTGEVNLLYVHPDRWGTGIGSLLHDRLLAELRTLGYAEAYLWVADGNTLGIDFYVHKGWTRTEDTSDHDENPPIPIRRFTIDL
ncbi:GNAT family N-acetyltransferase [Actinokineospora auranticolor]|uniref:Acetyltransferase (GNAT) family protein n=1 Tax=Actinokineospora auranticolor TaxID=155976 RepID=A0A2S6GZ35_9PSEU|nr:GNAT family N-acetyltransferase [Actinokineospora auranticolor]PPK70512.1 acetyltransferase (GNAT) family protein [Actinokineospora auranticolor]